MKSNSRIFSLIIVLAFVAGIFPAANGQSFLTNGLVAYYPLNGNANDASGNDNNGTTTNQVNFVLDRFGVSNGAAEFFGSYASTSSGIIVPAASSLNLTQSFTLSGWLFSTNFNPNSPVGLIAKGGNGVPSTSWMARWGSNGNYFSLWLGNGSSYQEFFSHSTYNLGTWEAFVISFNITNGAVNIYINGNLDANYTTSLKPTSTLNIPLALGTWLNGEGLIGCLDDIRIYNRALSTNEVQVLYQYEATLPQIASATPALRLNTTNLVVGANYQIQASSDLINWTNYGVPFAAISNSLSQYVDATSSKGFFRILPVP